MTVILRQAVLEMGCTEEHFVGFISLQETAAAALRYINLKEVQSQV
jgi:hypothetical protein